MTTSGDGYPSKEQLDAYYNRKEREAILKDPAVLLEAVEAFGTFFDELTAATAKLKEKLTKLCPPSKPTSITRS